MKHNKHDASSATAADWCGSQGRTLGPTDIAAGLLRTYEARNALLGAELFHAPAWEILLLLETANGSLPESELQQLMNVPLPSLTRWIEVLAVRGLIACEPGAEFGDAYRLTDAARTGLADVLLTALRKPVEEG